MSTPTNPEHAECSKPTVPLERYVAAMDVSEMLWTVVANASNGDWTKQSAEWQEAAARWRDAYIAELRHHRALVPDTVRSATGTADAPARTGLPWSLDCGCSADANDKRTWCAIHQPERVGARGAPDAPPAPTPPADAPEPPWVELLARITNYLGNGGLFNPEYMEHDKVRDLIMDCRAALQHAAALAQENERLRKLWHETQQVSTDTLSAVAKQRDALAQERDALRAQLQEANDPLNDERNRHRAELFAMRQERDAWRADSDRMTTAWNESQATVARLTAELANATKLLENRLTLAEERCERLTAERDRLRAALDALYKTELHDNEAPFQIWNRMTAAARAALAPTQKETL